MANEEKKDESMTYQTTITVVGFVGGILWSFIGYIAYFLNFSKVGPSMILLPWALGDWKHGHLGHWIGILVIGVLSIGVAFVYRLVFSKINSIWPGILFGAGLWMIVFGFLHPLFEEVESLVNMDLNTLITTLSLYVVFGLFIGYSISYEYHERSTNEVEAIQD
ncbi:YqhR family membrane protein [Salipaludibacillus daqingensis]|uniref:YqhR family membrane protein n=1 Tax=Salipaludibacillus daqingensis TaxID=3041001 RepID=UPI0024736955|nr:YqhR family membrane protein [Salipaludibacillus daqingensis]